MAERSRTWPSIVLGILAVAVALFFFADMIVGIHWWSFGE